MIEPRREEIGRNWIIAIVALLVLLLVGIALYLRMSAPIRNMPRRGASLDGPSFTICAIGHGANGYNPNGAR